jgi:hypothetical protein
MQQIPRIPVWPVWFQCRLSRVRPVVKPVDITDVDMYGRTLIVWSNRLHVNVRIPFWVRTSTMRTWVGLWKVGQEETGPLA